jgi:hypothetical protein
MSVYTTRLTTAYSNREFYKIKFPDGEIKYLPQGGFDCRILATFLKMCWKKNKKKYKLCCSQSQNRQELWIEYKSNKGVSCVWKPCYNKHPQKKDDYYERNSIDETEVVSINYNKLIKFIEEQN